MGRSYGVISLLKLTVIAALAIASVNASADGFSVSQSLRVEALKPAGSAQAGQAGRERIDGDVDKLMIFFGQHPGEAVLVERVDALFRDEAVKRELESLRHELNVLYDPGKCYLMVVSLSVIIVESRSGEIQRRVRFEAAVGNATLDFNLDPEILTAVAPRGAQAEQHERAVQHIAQSIQNHLVILQERWDARQRDQRLRSVLGRYHRGDEAPTRSTTGGTGW